MVVLLQLDRSGEDKAKSAEQRKPNHQPFEDGLVDFPKQPAPEKDPRDHRRGQPEIELKAG
jgi:hypothetical protein